MDTGVTYRVPSLAINIMDYDPLNHIDFKSLNLCFADLEMKITAFASHRTQEVKVDRVLIEEMCSNEFNFGDNTKDIEKRCPSPSSNMFDISSSGGGLMYNKNLISELEISSSCDGNEIDVVGDVDMEEILPDDPEANDGCLLEHYVSNQSSPFYLVSTFVSEHVNGEFFLSCLICIFKIDANSGLPV